MPNCTICGRLLTDPKSIALGMGQTCWKKVNGDVCQSCGEKAATITPKSNWPSNLFDMPDESGGRTYRLRSGITDAIVVAELSDGRQYDVRHIVYHSPTGMSYGYLGSGPADCARSILADCVGLALADRWYQHFKDDFIARINYDKGGDIKENDIRAWVARKQQELPERS